MLSDSAVAPPFPSKRRAMHGRRKRASSPLTVRAVAVAVSVTLAHERGSLAHAAAEVDVAGAQARVKDKD
jgi:hypothetical protein